jgi:hypothetical protein
LELVMALDKGRDFPCSSETSCYRRAMVARK